MALLTILSITGCNLRARRNYESIQTQNTSSTNFPGNTDLTEKDTNTYSPNERSLKISVCPKADARNSMTLLPTQGSSFETRVHYIGVYDVTVYIKNSKVLLIDALRENHISMEEISAYARLDSRKGLCQEFTKTRYGQTFFAYRYPEYEIRFLQDFIYSEIGELYLVNELYVCPNNYEVERYVCYDTQEDWGLTFDVVEANSSSITLAYTQSGGNQLGELIVDFYYLDLVDEELSRLEGATGVENYQPKPVLKVNSTDEIILNWMDIYGPLPAGDYVMTLKVSDVYDTDRSEPLLAKFETRQSYYIEFTIY